LYLLQKIAFVCTKTDFKLDFAIHEMSAASQQNQHSVIATSMDPDQPAHPPSLIRIHTVRLQTL
jgi:hypothetical protein